MAGRNDPCPCGSGKKHKKCCLNKPIDCGPCDGPSSAGEGRCGAQSHGAMVCSLCNKRYARCHAHIEATDTMMRGHVMRVHPESVPSVIDQLVKSGPQLAMIRAEAAREPELWKPLLDYIAKHYGN